MEDFNICPKWKQNYNKHMLFIMYIEETISKPWYYNNYIIDYLASNVPKNIPPKAMGRYSI